MDQKPAEPPNSFEALGIIVPAEWDRNGMPNGWALSTYDENLYPIDTDKGEGRSMGFLSGRTIRVSGHLKETESGGRQITVEKYAVVSDL